MVKVLNFFFSYVVPKEIIYKIYPGNKNSSGTFIIDEHDVCLHFLFIVLNEYRRNCFSFTYRGIGPDLKKSNVALHYVSTNSHVFLL